jgi:hypothetical protein
MLVCSISTQGAAFLHVLTMKASGLLGVFREFFAEASFTCFDLLVLVSRALFATCTGTLKVAADISETIAKHVRISKSFMLNFWHVIGFQARVEMLESKVGFQPSHEDINLSCWDCAHMLTDAPPTRINAFRMTALVSTDVNMKP